MKLYLAFWSFAVQNVYAAFTFLVKYTFFGYHTSGETMGQMWSLKPLYMALQLSSCHTTSSTTNTLARPFTSSASLSLSFHDGIKSAAAACCTAVLPTPLSFLQMYVSQQMFPMSKVAQGNIFNHTQGLLHKQCEFGGSSPSILGTGFLGIINRVKSPSGNTDWSSRLYPFYFWDCFVLYPLNN